MQTIDEALERAAVAAVGQRRSKAHQLLIMELLIMERAREEWFGAQGRTKDKLLFSKVHLNEQCV